MLEFIILMVIIDILMKIKVGGKPQEPEYNPHDNGAADIYIKHNSWEFESVEDAMEFRELRKGGWRGNADDYYKWKNED